jgi:two-component system response regulator YesN
MVSLLIIDDEPRQVHSLASVIKRFRENYVVYEAFDGKSAWNVLESVDIDAVITDIRMPGMDGIELVKRIAERMPHIKMVLLTGYGEFQYARDALRHGVLDYLVKPIGLQEIKHILGLIENALAKEADLRLKSSVYRDHLFQMLLSGQLTNQMETDIGQILQEQGFGIVLAFGSDRTPECSVQVNDVLRRELDEQLRGLEAKVIFMIKTPSREWVALVGLRSPLTGIHLTHMNKGLQLCLEKIEDKFTFRFAVGISDQMALSVSNIQQAYGEAKIALRHRFYYFSNSLIPYQMTSPFVQSTSSLLIGREEILLRAIRASDWRLVSETVMSMFKQVSKAPFPDPDVLKTDLIHFVMRIGMQLKGILSESALSDDEQKMKTRIASCEDIQSVQYAVKEFLLKWSDAVLELQNNKNAALVRHCIEYLEQHYMEDISLDSMARQLRLSPSYCSNFFKTHMGIGFSEFLIRLRISKAKRLLLETDDKISDIALKVGFHDAAYFNKVFKRETGITPNTFRQSSGSVKTG